MNENGLVKFADRIFWNAYASAYDDIARYYKPYKVLADKVAAVVRGNIEKGRILDAGCGTGELSVKLGGLGYKVEAIDLSDAMLKRLKKKIKNKKNINIRIDKADLNRKLKYKENSFKSVINIHSLFMLNNIYFTIDEFDRVLEPGGVLIIAHHKPIKLLKVAAGIMKDEKFFTALISMLRLLRAGLFNVFLGSLHKNIYGNIDAKMIIDYICLKNYSLAYHKQLYNNFDELMVFVKGS